MVEIIQEIAPAKINLALSVTGKRTDGYHLLDTLVVFADVADWLAVQTNSGLTLRVEGRFARALADSSRNLVMEAAELLRHESPSGGMATGAAVVLTKNLPVSAGIGGGSADAAAALRALDRLWELRLGTVRLAKIGAQLGADVPMCVHSQALRARGTGEAVDLVPGFPLLHLVLANPAVPVSTAAVFAAHEPQGRPLPDLPQPMKLDELFGILAACGNDLEEPAISIAPAISEVLADLRAVEKCLLARMSGSGGTCFGLFKDRGSAVTAAAQLAQKHPDWWVVAARAQ